MDKKNLLDTILSKKNNLPKKQIQVANFIIENFPNIHILTISTLAKQANVGTTTVLRTINSLGYKSFHDFKKDFHDYTINNTSLTWWHLQKSISNENLYTEESSVNNTWNEISNILNQTINNSFLDNFNKAINMIISADSLHVLGLRTSKVAAIYFENILNQFYPKVNQLSYDSEFLYDRMIQFNKKDVFILISLSPYTTSSINAAKFCYERGHDIILITDHLSCPAAPYSKIVLSTKPSDKQYSIVPIIALIEALVIEIGRQTKNKSIYNLETLGSLLDKKNITTSE